MNVGFFITKGNNEWDGMILVILPIVSVRLQILGREWNWFLVLLEAHDYSRLRSPAGPCSPQQRKASYLKLLLCVTGSTLLFKMKRCE